MAPRARTNDSKSLISLHCSRSFPARPGAKGRTLRPAKSEADAQALRLRLEWPTRRFGPERSAFGCSHGSVVPSWRGQRKTPPMWIVAFESPFGCAESVNVIFGQNLERITRKLLRRVLLVESFAEGQQSELRLG